MLRLTRPLLFALAAALLSACAATLERPYPTVAARPQTVDMLHYDIALTIDHRAGYVRGEVDARFAALDAPVNQLVLDAVDLNIERVLDEQGQQLRFETAQNMLTIHLSETLAPGSSATVHVAYEAFPLRGLYFIAPTGRDPQRPWHVWSQGQSHDTRHWLPVWEQLSDRATHTLALTVPEQFMTLAAGDLVNSVEHHGRGTRTDSWSMTTAHPAYLITLVVGDLAQSELPGGSVPLPLVARQRDMKAAAQATEQTADMLTFFADFTGRDYPYCKYSQTFVDEFTAGGMENVSATTLYDEGLHDIADEPQIDITGLVAHELAHQWFGDLLSANDWTHLWINEGWADYAELIYLRHTDGPDGETAKALGYQRAGCQAELNASRPVVWSGYGDPDECFDDHNYNGAAARIRLLADQLGPEVFSQCVHAWVDWAAGKQVQTDDLQRVFSETSGQDLTLFFDDWFHSTGYPRFSVRVEPGPVLVARQVQGDDGWREVFHTTLEASWSRGGEEHSARFLCDSVETAVELSGSGPLDWVTFDSAHVLPGTVKIEQSQAAWAAQLLTAEDAITRLLAAQWFDFDPWVAFTEIRDSYEDDVRQALAQAARHDAFIDVRLAALSASRFDDSDDTVQLLAELAEDNDGRMRELALYALAEHIPRHKEHRSLLHAGLKDPNSSVVLAAATALVDVGEPGMLATLQGLFEERGAVRLQRDLIDLVATLDNPKRIPFFIAVAREDPERWVREAAVKGLAAVSEFAGDAIFRQLCASLHDESYPVRAAAARALAASGDPRAATQLLARWDLEVDSTALAALESALARLDN
ncbi:MAG: aminopeptidase N [Pseudohongiellaceae bacterium]